jgi:hypothetical protein
MKTNRFLLISCIMFLLVCGTAWAENQVAQSGSSPAILASLDKTGVAFLDEPAAAAIRGQVSPMYVLVKVLGLNTLDYGSGVNWTLNPLGYRYGLNGGWGWSNGSPVDAMDNFFWQHDMSGNDEQLLDNLSSLATDTSYPYWGKIYLSTPPDAPLWVKVFGGSLIGQKFYFGWRSMPYSEYSRREAVDGMKALIFGKTLFPGLGL